jgi:hypothetical protein
MNLYICSFLLFGTAFGLATFDCRHLFSEGPRKVDDPPEGPSIASRVFWVMVCTFLWPVMVLTGLNTAWILAKRRRRAALARP